MAKGIISRGYVLVRRGEKPSAVVQKSDAEKMARRFGGKVVSAAGLRYRTANGFRLIISADYPEVLARLK